MPDNECVLDGRLRVDNFGLMQGKGKRQFRWLRVDANDYCNLTCTYCRVPRSKALIDSDELQGFFYDCVESVANLQFGCGMEPTLDKRLADLMMMAKESPAAPTGQFVVQTNGTLLHRHDHSKMKAAGLNRLSVSIDSLNAEIHKSQRGGSDINQIISNLKAFQSNCADVEIQFICVVTSANVDTTLELARFARDLGVKRIAFRKMVYVPNHPNVVDADVARLVIPLERFRDMQQKITAEIGNSFEMSFYDEEQLTEHRKTMRRDSYSETDSDKPYHVETVAPKPGTDLLEGKKFFAIRGFMKSGTNWLCRLLNLHPDISCVGEFHWHRLSSPFVANLDDMKLAREKPELRHLMWMRLDRMIKECIVLANHPAATWVGDRTPSHIAPGLILGAKNFNLIRDGRDVLISRTYHFFNYPERFPRFAAMESNQKRIEAFQDNPNFFHENPDELLACEELLINSAQHWATHIVENFNKANELPEDRVLTVHYEKLHRDIEPQRRRLYEFLEVDPQLAGPLAFNTTPGFKKESPDRFLRKGAVGDWKNYLSGRNLELFVEHASEAMELGGYDC